MGSSLLVSTLVSLAALAPTAHAAITTGFPEVIALYSEVSFEGRTPSAGRCSGTFIHPRLVLTAAHCVRHFNASKMNGRVNRATDMSNNPAPDVTAGPNDVYILGKKWWGTSEIHPSHVYVSPDAIPVERSDLSLDFVEQDLAILEFAYPVAPSVIPVNLRGVSQGEAVTMVGFGHHGEAQPNGAGLGGVFPTKYTGLNTITMAELESYVTKGSSETCDAPDGHGDDWSICPGDSGSPLIDSATGQVLGVASASASFGEKSAEGKAHRKLSIYVDLSSRSAVEFIESTIREADSHPVVMPPKGRSGD